jgi:hypothetical protein
MKITLSVFVLIYSLFSFARTEICPDLTPSDVAPRVDVKLKFDNKKNHYVYQYTVTNLPEAKVPIWRFSIETDSSPISTGSPAGWEKAVYDKKTKEIYWVYKTAAIKPDSKLAGFEVVSKKAPGLVKAFVDGDVADTPIVKFETDEEEVDPEAIACPGFYNGEGNSDYVVLATRGPAILNRHEVKIRVKKLGSKIWTGNTELPGEIEFSPLDKDQTDLFVMGNKTIDINKIDFKTIEFGPGKAKFLPIKKVIINKFEDSGDADFMEALEKNKFQHLQITFNTHDLEARCNVDTALFLTAQLGNKTLFGAVNVNPVACDQKTFAREAKKDKYHKNKNQ